MLNKVELKYLSRDVENLQATLQKEVDEFLKNKDNSLEDRWEVWAKYSQKEHKSYILHYPEFLDSFELFIHKGDYPAKYETITWERIMDIYNNFSESDDYEDNYTESVHKIMEWLMEINLGSYKFDW